MNQMDSPLIDVLDLPIQPYGYLKRGGVTHVQQIFTLSRQQLMDVLQSNVEYYQELKTRLIQRGFMNQEHPKGPFADEEK